MFTISVIHVIHIHVLKTVWSSNHPLCVHFKWYKYLNCRPWRTEYIFVTPLYNKLRATRMYRVTTTEHVTDVNNRIHPLEKTSYSVLRFKNSFVASLLTQYWLACKLTCWKHNFDTHQSVTGMTAVFGTPWLHELWLGLVLTTGRSSITTFVLTWTGDCVCGHLLSSNETLDLR